MDEKGKTLPINREGIISTRGFRVMQCYYKEEEKTRQVLDAAGWFNTGYVKVERTKATITKT